jgi:hypothetical protein
MRRNLRGSGVILAVVVAAASAARGEDATWRASRTVPVSRPALHDQLALGAHSLELGLLVHDPSAAARADTLRGEGRLETELAPGTRLLVRQLYGIDERNRGVLGPTQLRLLFGPGHLEAVHASVRAEHDARGDVAGARLAAGAVARLGLATSASLDLDHTRRSGDETLRSRLGLAWQPSLASRIGMSVDVASSEGSFATAAGVQLDHQF